MFLDPCRVYKNIFNSIFHCYYKSTNSILCTKFSYNKHILLCNIQISVFINDKWVLQKRNAFYLLLYLVFIGSYVLEEECTLQTAVLVLFVVFSIYFLLLMAVTNSISASAFLHNIFKWMFCDSIYESCILY